MYQCQIEPAGERFVVNFAYGRRGSTLNTGTKTNVPVDYDSAKRIFDKLVKEKQGKGYTEGESGTPYQHSEQQPSGIFPQLLNPIGENQVLDLMNDDQWCAQEKHDGRRLLVRKQGQNITGINKKGHTVGLALPLFDVVKAFDADVVIDGESIGDQLHAFDLLELQPKARIEGDVHYRALEMHQGALVAGQLRPMMAGEEKPTLKLAANNA